MADSFFSIFDLTVSIRAELLLFVLWLNEF